MLIFYTSEEGGRFIKLVTQMTKELIVIFLNQNIDKEIKRSYFYNESQGETAVVIVHSVMFPDGDVWDSALGGFRTVGGAFGPDLYNHLIKTVGE